MFCLLGTFTLAYILGKIQCATRSELYTVLVSIFSFRLLKGVFETFGTNILKAMKGHSKGDQSLLTSDWPDFQLQSKVMSLDSTISVWTLNSAIVKSEVGSSCSD